MQHDDDNMSTNSYLKNQYQSEKTGRMGNFAMGYRESQFGYNQLPDLDPYKPIQHSQNHHDIQFMDPLAQGETEESGIGQFFIDDSSNI